MKKNNRLTKAFFKLILASIFLLFVTTNAKAQDVTAKEILTPSRKSNP